MNELQQQVAMNVKITLPDELMRRTRQAIIQSRKVSVTIQTGPAELVVVITILMTMRSANNMTGEAAECLDRIISNSTQSLVMIDPVFGEFLEHYRTATDGSIRMIREARDRNQIIQPWWVRVLRRVFGQ